MEAYTAFAKVYDKFMVDVPYDIWVDFIDFVISRFGISKPERDARDLLESERNLVLDLGCGTGIVTRKMYELGYDMIGVDISQEMLDEAVKQDENSEILYICQDMCELDLYSTIGTVYSTCDSINYLLEDSEIKSCFANVSNYLYPGGLFIFDFNTIYKYKEVIGESTIADNDDDCSFIWDNFFDESTNINEYDLTLFIKDEESDLFRRDMETHYQRGYEPGQICDFLKESGLVVMAVLDERILNESSYKDEIENKIKTDGVFYKQDERTQRYIVVAKKPVGEINE